MKIHKMNIIMALVLSGCNEEVESVALNAEDVTEGITLVYDADLYPLLDGGGDIVDKDGVVLEVDRSIRLRAWHRDGWFRALLKVAPDWRLGIVPQGSTVELEMMKLGERDGQKMVNELIKNNNVDEVKKAIESYVAGTMVPDTE